MEMKQAIYDLATKAVEGNADPADTYAKLYSLRKALDECIELVKTVAVSEVAKYGKEGVEKEGYVLTTKAGAGRWKYTSVTLHTELQAKLKAVEALAQAAYKTGASIADENGQLIEPAGYIAGDETIVCTKAK